MQIYFCFNLLTHKIFHIAVCVSHSYGMIMKFVCAFVHAEREKKDLK